MGQNCVAGTTEFDEENGIGLVMYVESGNNMIVWKMSDGTKQGTTVPVSSDYQNMLRSAFENKTGTTIGYFIFHPYREETIDIESSITINSGDTPVENTFKWGIMGSAINLLVGKYEENAISEHLDAYLYLNPTETEKWAVVNENGVLLGSQIENETLAQRMLQDMESKLGKQVDQIYTIPYPGTADQPLPNWESYESMNP